MDKKWLLENLEMPADALDRLLDENQILMEVLEGLPEEKQTEIAMCFLLSYGFGYVEGVAFGRGLLKDIKEDFLRFLRRPPTI